MRSGNPVLTNDTFSEVGSYNSGDVMSIQGTTNKSFILLFLVMLTATWAWSNPGGAIPFLLPKNCKVISLKSRKLMQNSSIWVLTDCQERCIISLQAN